MTFRGLAWIFVAAAASGGAAYFFFGYGLVADAYYQRAPLAFLNGVIGHALEHPLGFYFLKADYLVYFSLSALLTAALVCARIAGLAARRALDWAMFALSAALFYFYLRNFGAEFHWYLFKNVMDLQNIPPTQHRMLFVVPAQALCALFPHLSDAGAFFWTQAGAIVLALWAVKRFAALFVAKELAFAAQFLTVLMWAPTLDYFTFYDIGILFVYAFCLYHLLRGEWRRYLLMFALGTYNHEITLFLVAVSAAVWWGRMPRVRLAALTLAQIVSYGLVRASLFLLIPAERAWSPGRIPKNLDYLFHQSGYVVSNLWPLVFWYLLAGLATRYAPQDLRRCWVLLPCLILMTFFFGQYNEARQFDAFIPVVAAFLVCWLEKLRMSANLPHAGRSAVRAS